MTYEPAPYYTADEVKAYSVGFNDGEAKAEAECVRRGHLTGADLAAMKRVSVEQIVVLMENEGVVTWGDERHRQRFLDHEAQP